MTWELAIRNGFERKCGHSVISNGGLFDLLMPPEMVYSLYGMNHKIL